MISWRSLLRGLRGLFHRQTVDREIDDEVQHYLAESSAAHRASGLSSGAAARAARMELGGVTQVREQVRSFGWEHLLDSVAADLRHAFRRLAAEPGFAIVTVLTLALGLGASTAILSVVNPVLFQPLPYPTAERIVTVWDRGSDGAPVEMTYGSFLELRERAHDFEALSVARPWQPTLTGASEPERLEAQRVSDDYFRVLGVAPALGRDFLPEEDRPGGSHPVVLSDGLWRRRFGGDSAILGRTLTMGDEAFTVIGVMPRHFQDVAAPAAELWGGLEYDLSQGRAWGHHLRLLARVRPGVDPEDAARELDAIARTPLPEYARQPWAAMAAGLLTIPLREQVTAGVRPALLAVLAAVALLLIIACVNVTNLLLARGVRRQGEFAVRAALGAGRGRLVRQLLTEHLVLALLGGVVGLWFARVGVAALLALRPPGLPRLGGIDLDQSIFGFCLGLTLLTGLGIGLVAAVQSAGPSPHGTLQLASRRSTGGHRRAQGVLVVAQVALALLLLTCSGLLLQSLRRLLAVEPGIDPTRLLTLQIQTSGTRFGQDSTTYRFFQDALEAVQRVPGVSGAALTSQLPLSGDLELYGVRFERAAASDTADVYDSYRYAVSPGYFETMGIPLRRGRLLEASDRAGAPPVAVISAGMARRRLPGLDPIGQRLTIGEGRSFTVVGVVGDVKQLSLALDVADAVYTTAVQWRFADRAMSLVVRERADAAGLTPAIRRAIWSVDPDQAIVRVATMESLVADSAGERSFVLRLFGVFGLSALVLAAAGIYGVLSGSVAERTREIGVRAALGANPTDILALVLRQGMGLTGLGVGIGLLAALYGTRFLATLLYAVSPLDPTTYLGTIALLATVALGACAVPAWRASRVDPVRTLRAE